MKLTEMVLYSASNFPCAASPLSAQLAQLISEKIAMNLMHELILLLIFGLFIGAKVKAVNE